MQRPAVALAHPPPEATRRPFCEVDGSRPVYVKGRALAKSPKPKKPFPAPKIPHLIDSITTF